MDPCGADRGIDTGRITVFMGHEVLHFKDSRDGYGIVGVNVNIIAGQGRIHLLFTY